MPDTVSVLKIVVSQFFVNSYHILKENCKSGVIPTLGSWVTKSRYQAPLTTPKPESALVELVLVEI